MSDPTPSASTSTGSSGNGSESNPVEALSRGVASALPFLYVAWADGLLTPSEIALVRERLAAETWMTPADCAQVEAWLDPAAPPDATTYFGWVRAIRRAASHLPDAADHSLADLGVDLAALAGQGDGAGLPPEARLVHMVRDPRDVAASTMTMRWGPSDPKEAAWFVGGVLDQWAEVQARVPAERILEVRLEDLGADPAAVLRQITDFLGLDWHDALLDADLSKTGAGRWRRLPPAAQAVLSEVLAPHVVAYGYEAA